MYKTRKSLSICLMALNEENCLEKTTLDIYEAAKSILDEFELIIIDDGSTDNTYKIALDLQNKLGHEIILVKNQENQGVGIAFFNGVKVATCEYVVGFPADGAFLIEGIKRLFEAVGKADVILGYRANLCERPPLRYFLSRCINFFVCAITFKRIKDSEGNILMPLTLCGKFHMKIAKYNFHMQVACYILNQNISYKEVPVVYAHDADAHSGMIRLPVLIDVVKSLFQILWLKLSGKLNK